MAPEESLEETLDGTRGLRQRNQSVRVREGNSTFFRHSEVAPSGGAVGAAGGRCYMNLKLDINIRGPIA